MSRRDEIHNLIINNNRRLQALKQRKALYGLDTSVAILTEIEDIETEIKELETELEELENGTEQVVRTNSTTPDNTQRVSQRTKYRQVWWVVAVFMIGLAGIIILLVINNTASFTLQPFEYLVRVIDKGTGEDIPNAKITIELTEKAPLDEITDANGFSRIFIPATYIGEPGRLLVEADGYKLYRQEIDLLKGNLPDTLQLEPLP